jgi:hypothetical protein
MHRMPGMTASQRVRSLSGITLVSFVALWAPALRAEENIARDEGNHPMHLLELEPHGLLAPVFDNGLPGFGVRATFTLIPTGFIGGVNDSVGLGFGGDWTRDTTWVPVVMQWNFWLSPHWSVFGEPGVALRLRDDAHDRKADFTIYGGGRYRFGRAAALTARLGYPAASLGVSFFL